MGTALADGRTYFRCARGNMDPDEILEKMITRAAAMRTFEDWAGVLSKYANCLAAVEPKISEREMNALLNAGADFYRTLARAQAYRANGVKPE